jgi:RNA polymerase sigma factor (sigma-70 family)
MHEQTEAERYLLEEIRRGSSEAWSQLVDRYQGRLIAFARRRAPRGAEPEDLVQDTFFQFLRGLGNYRADASIETFLFLILRRKITDALRGGNRAMTHICFSACETSSHDAGADQTASLPAPDPTASWYIRRDEQRDAARSALTAALWSLVRRMQDDLDFQDLQIAELVFYAQWKNQQIATTLDIQASRIGMLKHRWLKQLQDRISSQLDRQTDQATLPWDTPELLDSLLTEIWEDQRPSCPKRSTLGGFVLGTLDTQWMTYIEFHLNRLRCSFCLANLEDLQAQSRHDPSRLHRRILQSTVGFFRPT